MTAITYLDVVRLRQRIASLRAEVTVTEDKLRRIEKAIEPRRAALARLEAALVLAENAAAPVCPSDE